MGGGREGEGGGAVCRKREEPWEGGGQMGIEKGSWAGEGGRAGGRGVCGKQGGQ